MTQIKFDIIEWLSGLTNFIFDKAVLKRVAIECGVAEVKSYADIGEEERDRCRMALLETIVFGPAQTASSTSQHGSYSLTVGAQTVSAASLECIKAELRRLYGKYGETGKMQTLDEAGGEMKWIEENY